MITIMGHLQLVEPAQETTLKMNFNKIAPFGKEDAAFEDEDAQVLTNELLGKEDIASKDEDAQEITPELVTMFSKITLQEDTTKELPDQAAKTQDAPADAVEVKIKNNNHTFQQRTSMERQTIQDEPAKKKQRQVWQRCANPTCTFTRSNYNQSKWLHFQVTGIFNNS